MKTAISIPDSVFTAAERLAHEKGMTRSELYARAIAAFVEIHRSQRVTEALNRIYAAEPSRLDSVLARLQLASLPDEDW